MFAFFFFISEDVYICVFAECATLCQTSHITRPSLSGEEVINEENVPRFAFYQLLIVT